jgi:Flp pilus assembly protein TadG
MRRDDAGAVLVLVSIMMVVLLGMGALVVDVGQLYAERRELQNGADAAALAVAQDCADGDCLDETATARTYANANAHDGQAGIQEVCGSGPGLVACATPPAGVPATSWVKVKTVTPDDNKVDFVFAPVLGHDAGKAGATAITAWSAAGRASTIPVTFSVCEFKALGGSLDGSTFPSKQDYVYTHGTDPSHNCKLKSNGQDLPGGFGWLVHDEATCKVTIDADDTVGSETGNDTECKDHLPSWRGADVLIPLYDATSGGGSGGSYHIVGFAAFSVQAYCLGGKTEWYSTPKDPKGKNWPKCSTNRWFFGEFTHFVASAGGTGGGTDFGVTAIEMIG